MQRLHLPFLFTEKGKVFFWERKQYEDNYYTGYDMFRKKYAMQTTRKRPPKL